MSNPAPSATSASIPPALLERLQRSIQEILLRLHGRETEQFRSLCCLALEWEVDPEGFRLLLVGAGLRKPRASEIKSVLLNRPACDAFLKGQPWKQTLAQAQKTYLTELEQTARELVRRLAVVGEKWPSHHLHEGWRLLRSTQDNVSLTCPAGSQLIMFKGRFWVPDQKGF